MHIGCSLPRQFVFLNLQYKPWRIKFARSGAVVIKSLCGHVKIFSDHLGRRAAGNDGSRDLFLFTSAMHIILCSGTKIFGNCPGLYRIYPSQISGRNTVLVRSTHRGELLKEVESINIVDCAALLSPVNYCSVFSAWRSSGEVISQPCKSDIEDARMGQENPTTHWESSVRKHRRAWLEIRVWFAGAVLRGACGRDPSPRQPPYC